MNSFPLFRFLVIFFVGLAGSARAQTTAFTYQGRLSAGGTPANGQYEMNFTLYDAVTNGNVAGTGQTIAPVAVSNGLFTATLDFGASAFNGNARWLEISVTVFGSDQPVVVLRPRQPITSTPYAIQAANAANLMSFTPGPLDVKVNGQRALRLELGMFNPQISGAPNFIGGSSVNSASPLLSGVTIAGGGAQSFFGQPVPNIAESDFTSIGGGMSNHIFNLAFGAVIAGGMQNTIFSEGVHSTIGGGFANTIDDDAGTATISGGRENRVTSDGGTIGGGWGNTASAYATVGGGADNQITLGADHSTIGGGLENRIETAAAIYSTIGGGYSNTVRRQVGTIGGGWLNLIDTDANFATIGGGLANYADGDSVVIAGGEGNAALYDGTVVGGGAFNSAEDEFGIVAGGYRNTNYASAGFIGGGFFNTIGGDAYFAVIAGGEANQIQYDAEHSFIGAGGGNQIFPDVHYCALVGGERNVIASGGTHAFIGGGFSNVVSGSYATLAGGYFNQSGGTYSMIGGGFNNTSSGEGSTVAGGAVNQGTGGYATAGGGYGNIVSGNSATVPGGAFNRATGAFSFAAGNYAQALHEGAFVWADTVYVGNFFPVPFLSTTTNEFAARATGGVRFITAIDTNGSNVAGVSLAHGSGTWATLSDRNAKENLASANGREILEKVAALPLATWNYKTQDKSIRHIGPMAQDFRAAFGVGENERTITTVDADGVALAAIQGLNQKLEETQNTVKEKDTEIQQLKRRLDLLEKMVQDAARQHKGDQ